MVTDNRWSLIKKVYSQNANKNISSRGAFSVGREIRNRSISKGWPHSSAISRVGVNSGIERELSSIPDSIPGIGLGIGIEKKGIGIELELTKNARN